MAIGGLRLVDASFEGGLVLYNTGTEPCTVGGRPDVQLFRRVGDQDMPMPMIVTPWQTDLDVHRQPLQVGGPTPAPGQGLVPGSVGIHLAWANECPGALLGCV